MGGNSTFSATKFKPILSLGRLLFFDYKKNKFGLISDIKCDLDIIIPKVYVLGSSLSTDKELEENEIVIFLLNKDSQGFYAMDVKPISDIDIASLNILIEFIGLNDIKNAIKNTIGNDYKALSENDKEIIGNVLLKFTDPSAWEILLKIGNENIIAEYLKKNIYILSINEEIIYLQQSYNSNLFNDLIAKIRSSDKPILISAIEIIKKYDICKLGINNDFIDLISQFEWEFWEIWDIYKYIDNEKIAAHAISLFSFKEFQSIEKVKLILSKNYAENNWKIIVRSKLKIEAKDISGTELLKIFEELSEFRIILNPAELLCLIKDKDLDKESLGKIIGLLNENLIKDDLRNLIRINKQNISFSKFLDLLKNCRTKKEIWEILIDEYFVLNKDNNFGIEIYQDFFDYIKTFKFYDFGYYFLEKFGSNLTKEFPLYIFEFSMIIEHATIQKYSYENITFKNEKELIQFIKTSKNIQLKDEVRSVNKPLTDYLELMNKSNKFALTDSCKNFLLINQGIAQILLVKYLIYQYYCRTISHTELLKVFDKFQWTEISAILLITFIKDPNCKEKNSILKLADVFKAHFNILSNSDFDLKSFQNNFTIRRILKTCDGRKFYDAKLWKKADLTRWYVKENVTTYSQEPMGCYCEGRPWKKEYIWSSRTKRPSEKKYNFYWCRNNYCAQINDHINLNQPYYDWTLREFAQVFGIKMEDLTYAILAGWVNRMNQITKKLFCNNCNSILRPIPYKPKQLGFYAVPLFNCINETCIEYGKPIRFTHCWNNECDSHKNSMPLDSRECKSCCPTGLICNYCHALCPKCSGHSNIPEVIETW